MSKFKSTVDNLIDLYESGSGLSYGGTRGAFTQHPDPSPLRFPGSNEQIPFANPHINKYKIEKDGVPPQVQQLEYDDNEGLIRQLINYLAIKKRLTPGMQEMLAKIKALSKISKGEETPIKKPLNNLKQEKPIKSKVLVGDEVEFSNNPNRPHLSFSQT